jgi:hypothetical protein
MEKYEWKNHLKDLLVDFMIIIDLKEIGWEVLEWKDLAQERKGASCCEQGNDFSDFIKSEEFLD